jgi:hypothetical protein
VMVFMAEALDEKKELQADLLVEIDDWMGF